MQALMSLQFLQILSQWPRNMLLIMYVDTQDILNWILLTNSASSVVLQWQYLQGFTFKIGAGLTETQMRALGLYVSSPTDYIEQSFNFAEAAYFYLTADGLMKYIDVSSHPM